MDNVNQQIAARIKEANNVLVTVSNNPTVDQLAAAIGLSLLLNKLNKHATAVFSGKVPSTLEFLKPEKTLEKNTDSLRDFIIALDKSKADKLRYKVEDDHVKIFITPYRTSISQNDLQFSQGDFNVDVVIALGVHEQKDLDQAIVTHGRILHDAAVISINNHPGAELGSMNLVDEKASSLCEIVATVSELIQENPFDGQMATAFLTGIVAETERFSNQKTSSTTMGISAKLMAAGANQQLVAEKLEPAPPPPPPAPVIAAPVPEQAPAEPVGDVPAQSAPTDQPQQPVAPEPKPEAHTDQDGALLIDHNATEEQPAEEAAVDEQLNQIHIDENGEFMPIEQADPILPPAPIEQPVAPDAVSAPVAQEAEQQPAADPQQDSNQPELSLPPVDGTAMSDMTQPTEPVLPPADMPPLPPRQQESYEPQQPAQVMSEPVNDDSHMQPEPQVIAPESAHAFLTESQDAVSQALGMTDPQPASDSGFDESAPHPDMAVQGHKVINPLPDSMPHFDPTAALDGLTDNAPGALQLPPTMPAPPVPPPMMPDMAAAQAPANSNANPLPGNTVNPNDLSL